MAPTLWRWLTFSGPGGTRPFRVPAGFRPEDAPGFLGTFNRTVRAGRDGSVLLFGPDVAALHGDPRYLYDHLVQHGYVVGEFFPVGYLSTVKLSLVAPEQHHDAIAWFFRQWDKKGEVTTVYCRRPRPGCRRPWSAHDGV
jgi:hypothetical protein